MKKVLLSALLLLALSLSINAQQRVYLEDFNYTAGDALLNHGWTISGSSTVNPLAIASPGLTFPGLTTVGNALALADNGQDAYVSFTASSTGSVYLGFLLKVTTAGTGDYFIALSPTGGQTNYYARLHVKATTGGYLIGLSKSNEVSGGATYGTTVLAFGTTYMVVVKHTFVAATTTDDTESVYVFSAALPATEPSTAEILNYTAASKTDPTDLSMITVRQGSAGSAPALVMDCFMVSTGWNKLTTAVTKENNIIPNEFSLDQNYPNPFNPSTQISFSVPSTGNYTLKVYDVLGKEVQTLVNQELSAGKYKANFNASGLASGTYIYRLTGNNVNLAQKMMLVK